MIGLILWIAVTIALGKWSQTYMGSPLPGVIASAVIIMLLYYTAGPGARRR